MDINTHNMGRNVRRKEKKAAIIFGISALSGNAQTSIQCRKAQPITEGWFGVSGMA
jgi:hypothetical protein